MTVEALRRCASCLTVLSRYNHDVLCYACDESRRDADLDLEAIHWKVDERVHGRKPRRPGASALPCRGYRWMLAWLLETRERLALRGDAPEDLAAFDRVIQVMIAEAERR